MTIRRISSRRVVLTATFLAIASGGTAACDTAPEDEWVGSDSGSISYEPDTTYAEPAEEVEPEEEVPEEEIFYCADENGEIVDEENCDDDVSAGGLYFLWHSTGYDRGLGPGERLYDGDYFDPGDKAARKSFKLPAAGRVTNGTVKTNVVGRGSTRSSASGGSGPSGS